MDPRVVEYEEAASNANIHTKEPRDCGEVAGARVWPAAERSQPDEPRWGTCCW